jgi:hypothetical protein
MKQTTAGSLVSGSRCVLMRMAPLHPQPQDVLVLRGFPGNAARELPKDAEQKEREMPKGARCRTAPDAEGREMPNGATARDAEGRGCRTARNGDGGTPPTRLRAVWHFAPSGISRIGALWHLARSGISRCLAFRAVWHSRSFCPAPFGISRALALRRSAFPSCSRNSPMNRILLAACRRRRDRIGVPC